MALPEYVAAASLFRVGWNMNSFVESTLSCLFLSRLKKGLNHSDLEHLECYFRAESACRETSKQPGRKGGNERGLQLDVILIIVVTLYFFLAQNRRGGKSVISALHSQFSREGRGCGSLKVKGMC